MLGLTAAERRRQLNLILAQWRRENPSQAHLPNPEILGILLEKISKLPERPGWVRVSVRTDPTTGQKLITIRPPANGEWASPGSN